MRAVFAGFVSSTLVLSVPLLRSFIAACRTNSAPLAFWNFRKGLGFLLGSFGYFRMWAVQPTGENIRTKGLSGSRMKIIA
jgi:hypothetical protein